MQAHLDVVTLDLGAADTEGALRGLLQQRGVSVVRTKLLHHLNSASSIWLGLEQCTSVYNEVVCRLSGDSVTEAGMRALAEAAAVPLQ